MPSGKTLLTIAAVTLVTMAVVNRSPMADQVNNNSKFLGIF